MCDRFWEVHVLTPLIPLSADAKRGNGFVTNKFLPLLCNSREGGRGDEYV